MPWPRTKAAAVSASPASAPSPDVEAHINSLYIFQTVGNLLFAENGEIEENMKINVPFL